MKLTPVMQRFILHWGEMGSRWGVNRSVAQIHALLYLSQEPLPADEITETLGIARSNVSNSLKELQSWNLVSVAHVLGDRRDHFQAKSDIWEILTTIADGRKRREIDPTVEVLRACVSDLKQDKATPSAVRDRIEHMLEFTEELSSWYDQIRKLPRKTLLKLMRMGGKVGKFIAA
ncbi:MAG: MarR family transcriptional regulator [Gammaproteobacteria bacterium]|nr:MarR family transcriptional regulator [Gammaproteobacteria bacterium]